MPLKRVMCTKSQDVPWLTLALKNSCYIKQKMYFAAINNAALWNNYKSYRNKLTSLLRLRKKHYYHEYINKHKNNARVMWELLNSHLGRLCNI